MAAQHVVSSSRDEAVALLGVARWLGHDSRRMCRAFEYNWRIDRVVVIGAQDTSTKIVRRCFLETRNVIVWSRLAQMHVLTRVCFHRLHQSRMQIVCLTGDAVLRLFNKVVTRRGRLVAVNCRASMLLVGPVTLIVVPNIGRVPILNHLNNRDAVARGASSFVDALALG